MSVQSGTVLAFQPIARGKAPTRAPGPDRGIPDPLPEREWGLSAGQVVAVVVAIVAACHLLGLVFQPG